MYEGLDRQEGFCLVMVGSVASFFCKVAASQGFERLGRIVRVLMSGFWRGDGMDDGFKV